MIKAAIAIPFILTATALQLPTWSTRIAFLTHPFHLLTALIVYFLTRAAMKTAQVKKITQRPKDEHFMDWFFLTGVFVHLLMNGLMVVSHLFLNTTTPRWSLGNFREALPQYFQQPYALHTLAQPFFDARHENIGDHPVVFVAKLIDLFCLAPLAMAVYYAHRTRATYRAPLQLVTAVLQIVNVVFFRATDLLQQIQDFSQDEVVSAAAGTNRTTQLAALLVLDLLLIVIPFFAATAAFHEIHNGIKINAPSTIPLGEKSFIFASDVFQRSKQRKLPTTPLPIPKDTEIEVYDETHNVLYHIAAEDTGDNVNINKSTNINNNNNRRSTSRPFLPQPITFTKQPQTPPQTPPKPTTKHHKQSKAILEYDEEESSDFTADSEEEEMEEKELQRKPHTTRRTLRRSPRKSKKSFPGDEYVLLQAVVKSQTRRGSRSRKQQDSE